ncbi:restriction endonuclease subunit S [Vibrio breoganii]
MKLHSETYDSYKNSEGEWSETIPSEWQEKRVKDLFKLVTDAAPADNNYELLSLFTGIGVKPRKDMEARGNKASSTDGYWIVKKNDIVVNKLLAWMGSVGLSEYDGVTSPAYDVLRQVKPYVDPRYFSYLFRTEIAKKIFRKNSRGIMDMRLRLYFDKLGAITVPLPSLQEQSYIADYIDLKTSQIDKKIVLLKTKIKLYKKLKLSLINENILQGLNKPKLSAENIECESPGAWKIGRIKDIAHLNTGNSLSPDLKEKFSTKKANTTPYVATKDIEQSTGIANTKNGIYIPNSETKYRRAPKHSSLLCVEGASAGKKMSFIDEEVCYVNKLLCFFNNQNINPLYLHYYISTTRFKTSFNSSLTGLRDGYWGVTGPEISRFEITLPPLDEQREIAQSLKVNIQKINNLVAKINDEIDMYLNLRNAFITDATTGKVKAIMEPKVA